MNDLKKIIDKELESMTFNEVKNRRSIKMKKNFKIKKITAVCAAAVAAVVIVGGTVYAASPEVRETVNNILGINREAAQDYYDIYDIEDNSKVTDIDIIGNALTVTENDFTEFAPGIRAKLVSVVNSGNFAEVLLEFEFDEPVKDVEYTIDDMSISAFPKYISSYTYGFLTVSNSDKIYSSIRLNDIRNVAENMPITMEIKCLDKANGKGMHSTDETYTDDASVKIYGNFSANIVLGKAIKSKTASIEPREINWSTSLMGEAQAHMDVTALKYSPKSISFDLRMLEDCLVMYEDANGGEQYLNNNTAMFSIESYGGSETPIKLKMSDGTLKDVWYSDVISNAVNDIDKNTLLTDMDWIMASWDIPSDKPATVTFMLSGIMDYSDVEAIVFCGEEFPIS